MSRYVWLIALVPGAALVDCRQVAGITDAPPEKLTTSISGLPYGTPSCAQCVNTSCFAESDACAGDPSCAAYQSCFGPCAGDPACWSKCIIDHPTTGAAVSALSACMASRCEDACDLTCGGFFGRPFPPSTATACQSCLVQAQKRCAQTRACATSASCDQAQRCINAAPTYDLVDSCLQADGVSPSWSWNPDAGSSALTEAFAAQSSCGPPCAGTDWHCVGQRSWPALASVRIPYTLDLDVENYSPVGPESGVLVELCALSDLDCATPITHGTTDPGGNVSLSFDLTGAGGPGLTGYLKLTRDDLLTSYVYWGFPLSGTELSTRAQVVTKSANASLLQNGGIKPDPSRGNIAVATFDCQFGVAPGLTVTIEPSDQETKGLDPNGQPTTITDSNGLIFFANVPAGPAQVTVSPPGLMRPSSTVPVNVRTDGETVVYAYPTP
jgi:hypothetical protein